MQMLFTSSEESPGATPGLGHHPWRRSAGFRTDAEVPQMQWNRLEGRAAGDPMLVGLGDEPWFYFVHSLHGVPDDPDAVVVATVGTQHDPETPRSGSTTCLLLQFHPEKSSRRAWRCLSNFVGTCAPDQETVMETS